MDDKVWFTKENTEGYSPKELEIMNDVMNRMYRTLETEQKENQNYLQYLQEKILYVFSF